MKIFIKILFILLWVATAAGSVLLMGFANNRHDSKKVAGINCMIEYAGKTPLLSNEDVLRHVFSKFGKLTSEDIGMVEIGKLTSHIERIPYLEHVNVKINIDGIIEIKAHQCTPVVRLMAADGHDSFIADNGRIVPVNLRYPYKSQIATGNLGLVPAIGKNIFADSAKSQNSKAPHTLQDVFYLATIINSDSILDALVEQINISQQNEIQIITKAGSHLIELGDTTDLKLKLENLKYFYKEGLVKTGWNKYSKLNLRYRNQIVCTK